MSELFGVDNEDKELDRVFMFPEVRTNDALDLAEQFGKLRRAGMPLEEIVVELEVDHAIDATELLTWILEDPLREQPSS